MQFSGHCKKLLGGLIVVALIQLPALLQAQVLFETLPATKSEGKINIYGRGTLSQRIPYEIIKGSPFWSDEWKSATLYGASPKEKWEQPIKLNLATNEIYFINNREEELVINDGLVQKIVFHDRNDPEKKEAQFINGVQPPFFSNNKINGILQVLNDGKYQLLKQSSRQVMEGDSLFGTLKKYFFRYQTHYFIANKNFVVPLQKLNKENCLHTVPDTKENQQWITQNKIDLRKETDVVAFLNHLNEKK